MTDYELVSIFLEFVNTLWMIFATCVSIVFAFIVASYLVARRLTSKVVSLVISLYTLVSVWAIWGIRQNSTNISATAGEMTRRTIDGSSSLEWLPILEMPELMREVVPDLITLVTIVIFGGSVVFFFVERRTTRSSSVNE